MTHKLEVLSRAGLKSAIYLIVVALIIVFMGVLFFGAHHSDSSPWQDYDRTTITFDTGKELEVVLANTPPLRTRGLSYSTSLAPNLGMLFIFEYQGEHGFWMKDMKYPIDIFWFDTHGALVFTQRNVSPDSFPKIFGDQIESQYILETNVGVLADVQSIEKGIEHISTINGER
ncbi:DUF192 domain-containing protein [Candidatus Nomurabacteria bacterium]|nr:DUF192 domain-containing protein [Candidatus Nomurabacteria bacterium]